MWREWGSVLKGNLLGESSKVSARKDNLASIYDETKTPQVYMSPLQLKEI